MAPCTFELQVELHPLCAQRKLVGVSYRKGVVSVAHTCLGGQREGGDLMSNPVVASVAAETGKTVAQVRAEWFILLLDPATD